MAENAHGSTHRKAGPSNAYRRLLAGKITPERYVEILKRGIDMAFARDRKRGRRV